MLVRHEIFAARLENHLVAGQVHRAGRGRGRTELRPRRRAAGAQIGLEEVQGDVGQGRRCPGAGERGGNRAADGGLWVRAERDRKRCAGARGR